MSNKITATVKWFDTNKGFGFINGPDGDVFVHYRNLLQDGYKKLSEGDQVEFVQVHSSITTTQMYDKRKTLHRDSPTLKVRYG